MPAVSGGRPSLPEPDNAGVGKLKYRSSGSCGTETERSCSAKKVQKYKSTGRMGGRSGMNTVSVSCVPAVSVRLLPLSMMGGFFMLKETKITTKQLVFSAMAIALATVISAVVKLPSLPNGGSVTLFSMLLVTLVGYWYGPVVGITAATGYGILQFFTGPYVVHPLQVILDYPLAFGALGCSGFFSHKKHGLLKGYLAGVLGRFFFAALSGIFFYTVYVEGLRENMAAIWAGLVYNMTYILPEAALTVMLLLIPAVRKGLAKIKEMAT